MILFVESFRTWSMTWQAYRMSKAPGEKAMRPMIFGIQRFLPLPSASEQ